MYNFNFYKEQGNIIRVKYEINVGKLLLMPLIKIVNQSIIFNNSH